MATNFCCANSAAINPDKAPRHWWNFTVGVPHAANVPAAWLPASPKARAMVSASNLSNDPTAAAAPNGPKMPGPCQPRARNFG